MAREPGPVKGGKTVIAFVEDPTGYKWELIERQPPVPEPVAQVLWNCTSQHRVLLCIRATPGPPCAWAPPAPGASGVHVSIQEPTLLRHCCLAASFEGRGSVVW